MVRVGPNEVWFNSKAAFKAIYSELLISIEPSLMSLIYFQAVAAAMRNLISIVSAISHHERLGLWHDS